jgi:predicted Zn-dependent protease
MRALAILFFCGCLATGCVGPGARSSPPVSGGVEIEAAVLERSRIEQQQIRDENRLYRNPRLSGYLNRIARRLQPPGSLRIQVFVLEDPRVNAFAYPDGSIYVHTGLLACLENEAQLAAVLAHEVAHCTEQHALKVFKRKAGQTVTVSAINEDPDATGSLRRRNPLQDAERPSSAFSGYCRRLELEADRVGLDLLVNAHYDPKESLAAFRRLAAGMLPEGAEEPVLRAARRLLAERLTALRKRLADAARSNRSGMVNQARFLAHIRPVFLENAWLELKMGRLASAAVTAQKYYRLKPGDARAHFLLGEIARQQGGAKNSERALAHYRKSISLDPNFAEPHKASGLIHFKAGHKQLAKKHFDACLSMSPTRNDDAYIRDYIRQCNVTGEDS